MSREVLAELDFDEEGAVSSLRNLNSATNNAEGQTRKFAGTIDHEFGRAGPAFVHHMFSMRAAAAALIGGFSLAGIITSIVELTKTLVENSDTWKMVSDAAHDFFNVFVLGEDSLTRVDQALKNIGITTRTMNIDEATKKLDEAFSIQRKAAKELDDALHPEKASLFVQAFSDWTKESIRAASATKALESATEGVTQAQIGVQKAMGIYSDVAPKIEGTTLLMDEWAHAIAVSNTQLEWLEVHGPATFDNIRKSMHQVIDLEPEWQENMRKDQEQLEWLETHGPGTFQKLRKGFEDLTTSQKLGAIAAQAFADATIAGLSAWAEGASMTGRKFFHDMLMMVGQALMAWGALAIIEGWVTENHTKTVQGWIAIGAGVAALAAAHAVGGGSQAASSGGSSGGGGNSVSPRGQAGPSYSIVFQIEGNVIGNEDFFRQGAVWIKRALADGAAGGSLALSG